MKLSCDPIQWDPLLDYLYPPHCPMCGKKILQLPQSDRIRLICPECVQKVLPVGSNYCLKCGKPLTDAREEFCDDCRRRRHYFEQGRAVFSYQGPVKTSLYRLKYANCREYARFYAVAMAACLGDWIRLKEINCIIPIPLYPSKMRNRGYNQAELIARRLGDLLDLQVDTSLLLRIRNTLPQKNLTGAMRRANLMQAFQTAFQPEEDLTILLIDDIYTTGSTMDAAAGTLKAAGIRRVYAACAAIGG